MVQGSGFMVKDMSWMSIVSSLPFITTDDAGVPSHVRVTLIYIESIFSPFSQVHPSGKTLLFVCVTPFISFNNYSYFNCVLFIL